MKHYYGNLCHWTQKLTCAIHLLPTQKELCFATVRNALGIRECRARRISWWAAGINQALDITGGDVTVHHFTIHKPFFLAAVRDAFGIRECRARGISNGTTGVHQARNIAWLAVHSLIIDKELRIAPIAEIGPTLSLWKCFTFGSCAGITLA